MIKRVVIFNFTPWVLGVNIINTVVAFEACQAVNGVSEGDEYTYDIFLRRSGIEFSIVHKV